MKRRSVQKGKRGGRISLAHLSPEEALKRAMAVPYKAKRKQKKEEDAGEEKSG